MLYASELKGSKVITKNEIVKIEEEYRTGDVKDFYEKWNKLTPIQRNEWICWVTIVKKSETREDHIKRMGEELSEGKRQPCCWPGCPNRRPNAQKWFK